MAGPLTRLRDKELAAAKERHAQLSKIFLDPTTPETLRKHCSRQAETIRARFVTEFPHTLEQLAEQREANMDKKELRYEKLSCLTGDNGFAICGDGIGVIAITGDESAESESWARALVNRYNAHDDLVAALETCLEALRAQGRDTAELRCKAIAEAHAALAKAGAP